MEGGVCTLSLNYAPDLGTGKGPGEVSGLNAQFVCSFVLGKGKDQDGEGAELIVLFSYPVLSKELLDRNGTDSPKKGVGLNAVGPFPLRRGNHPEQVLSIHVSESCPFTSITCCPNTQDVHTHAPIHACHSVYVGRNFEIVTLVTGFEKRSLQTRSGVFRVVWPHVKASLPEQAPE